LHHPARNCTSTGDDAEVTSFISTGAQGEGGEYRAELLVIERIQGVKAQLELGLRKEMNSLEQA
jgi:hypothetical protein